MRSQEELNQPELEGAPRYTYPLYADEIKEEYLQRAPLQQFVHGYYCDNCRKAFVPNEYLKIKKADPNESTFYSIYYFFKFRGRTPFT
jgi:hypothetical protein